VSQPGGTPVSATAYGLRIAMGTAFEVFLAGDDEEHLGAVADAVLEEVVRVERLLSRFDPSSEIARINRLAGQHPVVVDFEVFAILKACRAYHRLTGGYFDVTATHAAGQADTGEAGDALVLDEGRRTVSFARPGLAIDPGGFGKGYALDRARALMRTFDV